MINNSLVSVIIPVYNVEDYIAECLSSVCIQSYPFLEIIVVNDGSTDSSLKICNDFQKNDRRIKVISQMNYGVSSARNRGITEASGEFIVFVDSDDLVASCHIEVLLNGFLDDSIDIVTARVLHFWENNSFLKYELLDNSEYEIYTGKHALYEMLYMNDSKFDNLVYARAYRSSLIKTLHFLEGCDLYEDLGFVVQCLNRANNVCYTTNCSYGYRFNPSGISHKSINQRSLKAMDVADDLVAMIECNQDLAPAIRNRVVTIWLSMIPRFDGCSYEYRLEEQEIWTKIKENRLSVLLDSNSRIKTRLACLASFFGKTIYKKVFKIFYGSTNMSGFKKAVNSKYI